MPGDDLLVISSDLETVKTLKRLSKRLGLHIKVRKNITSGVKASHDSQITIIDCFLQDGNCIECLENLHALNNDLLAIVLVDENHRNIGQEALSKDAFFYTTKPFTEEEMEQIIRRALQFNEMKQKSLKMNSCSIEDFLRERLKSYVSKIQEVGSIALYETVISEVEKALLKLSLEETGGNQIKASKILGLNRNTVRNKLKKYKLL